MTQPIQLASGRLTAAQAARYADEGFLHPIPVIPADEAAAMRAELEALERDWLDAGLPRPLNQYKRVNAHTVMPLAARMAMDMRVLDVVEGVLGPDILIWSAEFFIKEPNTRAIVTMHQDLTYWGLGATQDQLTAWIALSPATRASGGMDMVKGSHKNAILPHKDTFDDDNLLSRGQEIAVEVADEDKTPVELMPGQMSLHHGLMFHGSGPNTTDDRRIALAVRYITPKVKQEVAERDYAMLARGADRDRNFIHMAPPQRPFEAQALKLYDEILVDQSAALAQGAKEGVSMYANLKA